MYIIGSTTKNVDLVSGFSCKSRQGRSTFVCVCVCARCKAVNYFFLRPSPRSSPLTKRKRLPSLPRN